ncbi:MAG: PIN domain-containing protein [Candidatus Altiarchaeota archaeon]
MRVLDTSAILRSDLDFSDGEYCLPDSVLDELESVGDEKTALAVAISIKTRDIKVLNPSENALAAALEAARATGDVGSLSETDLDVIALALQTSGSIVSDDYAIQNVASHLSIKFEPTAQDGIRKKVKWVKRCSGCGKTYGAEYDGDCSVCGSRLRREAGT